MIQRVGRRVLNPDKNERMEIVVGPGLRKSKAGRAEG